MRGCVIAREERFVKKKCRTAEPASNRKSDVIDRVRGGSGRATSSRPAAIGSLAEPGTEAAEKAEIRLRLSRRRRPEAQAGLLVLKYGMSNLSDKELAQLVGGLEDSNARIGNGDMSEPEAMLFSQAQALNSIFTDLAWRANDVMKVDVKTSETLLRLALKAQSQSRCSLEALAEIKNPRAVAFVKQANIAHGPQQVNNGSAAQTSIARAENPSRAPSKQLEQHHGERLDVREAGTASGTYSHLETVGAIDRAED